MFLLPKRSERVRIELQSRQKAKNVGVTTQHEQQSKVHIFVLIDALGWSVLKGRDFLNELLPHRQPLRTVLGFSSGAIPTILTGVSPAEHGHWNLFYYDPNGSPFRWLRWLKLLPDAIVDHRVTRKVVKELGRHVLGMGPLFECCVSPRLLPWFNWVEKRNIYDPGSISGTTSIFDQLAEKGVPYRVYSYHHAADKDILQQARRDIAAQSANFYFVYLCELDSVLHSHFEDKTKLEEHLGWYAKNLKELFLSAHQVDSEARLTIFSDHGMTPVRNRFDLVKEVEALGLSMPQDYLAVYDSTMARFWFFNPRAKKKVAKRLAELTCGRILPEPELRHLGVFFSDRRYGELIFLLHPGWLISRSDFNGKGWNPVGMHGYHPDDEYSDGIFLSSREPPFPVRTVTDVYQCLRQAAQAAGM